MATRVQLKRLCFVPSRDIDAECEKVEVLSCLSKMAHADVNKNRVIRAAMFRQISSLLDKASTMLPLTSKDELNLLNIAQNLEKRRSESRAKMTDVAVIEGKDQSIDHVSVSWFLECQCIALYLRSTKTQDMRAGQDFPHLGKLDLIVNANYPIMQYSLNAIRLAIYKIMRSWEHLPLLHDEFIDYLRLMRQRVSVICSHGYTRDERVLDYPQWISPLPNSTVMRVSMDGARDLENYFFTLGSAITHASTLQEEAKTWHDLCSQAEVEHWRNWLYANLADIYEPEFKREICDRALANSLYPTERFVYQRDHERGADTHAILNFFRQSRSHQIANVYNMSVAEIFANERDFAEVYGLIYMIQMHAKNFNLKPHFMFPIDVKSNLVDEPFPHPKTLYTHAGWPYVYVSIASNQYYIVERTNMWAAPSILHASVCMIRLLSHQHPNYCQSKQYKRHFKRLAEFYTQMKPKSPHIDQMDEDNSDEDVELLQAPAKQYDAEGLQIVSY